MLAAHQSPITSLFEFQGNLISGDNLGILQVRDTNASLILQSPQVQDRKLRKQDARITTITVMPGANPPIIMAGDMAGQINFLTMENAMPLECTMGGHNDKK